MKIQVIDSTGSGFGTKVDSSKRFHVDSLTRAQSSYAVLQGKGYNLNTGAITLTTAGTSALMYLESQNEEPLIIKEILVIAGTSTGGTGDYTAEIIKNPSDGTIVDNAVALDVNQNRNFGSSQSLVGNYYKGAEGYTTVGGDTFAGSTRQSAAVISFDADIIVLTKGTTLCVQFTPQTGNTSQVIRIAATVFLDNLEL